MNGSDDIDLDARLRRFLIAEAETIGRFATSDADMASRIGLAELRRSGRGPLAALAAAATIILVIGVSVALGTTLRRDGALPTSPSPSASALAITPTAIAGPRPYEFSLDELAAGTYVVDRTFPFKLQFELPEHWRFGVVEHGGVTMLSATDRGRVGVGIYVVTHLFEHPCHWQDGRGPRLEPRVDAFVDAMLALPSVHVSDPTEVSAFGYAGKQFDMFAPPDLGACDGSAAIALWGDVGRPFALGEADHMSIDALDVNGKVLVVATWDSPGADDSLVDEAQAVRQSIIIE